jgi:hypothetical protein
MATLSVLLDQIDSGTLLLPEFQRGYVWNRDQVRGLMRSLYRGYPVGGLLVWEAATDSMSLRGAHGTSSGVRHLLLDGQQRITSLYGVVRGKPPAFFEGDQRAFSGLRFNVHDETFEFFAPAKMKSDSRWVDVTGLFLRGLKTCLASFMLEPAYAPDITTYVPRLAQLHGLLEKQFHTEVITGADKTVDVVVDMFNRVNSGGTKLSKGDLALAKICADWPEARAQMRAALAKWRDAGYNLSLDWLLRNTNAVATGRAPFSALDGVSAGEFQGAMTHAVKYSGKFLNVVAGRLGLDHDRVLVGRYAAPVVARFLHLQGGDFADARERDRMLYWYVNAALRGRFSGSTESALAQDYETVAVDGIDGLVQTLARSRGGTLTIGTDEFEGFGRGSRFYPLLYLLTRVGGARDLGSGLPLKAQLLGHLSTLQVHHIFPKALLYAADYSRGEVNAVANFCFLTQDTNLVIGKRRPEEYLAEVEDKHPGALQSQWIPTDRDLWRIDRYPDFLAARRDLLAAAANTFLDELWHGTHAAEAEELPKAVVISEEAPDDREAAVAALVRDLVDQGYVEPQVDAEISDPDDGRPLAVAEAFWPEGLQPGQGNPVVLELDTEDADLPRLEELGYEIFTSIEALRHAVARRSEIAAGLRSESYPVDQP